MRADGPAATPRRRRKGLWIAAAVAALLALVTTAVVTAPDAPAPKPVASVPARAPAEPPNFRRAPTVPIGERDVPPLTTPREQIDLRVEDVAAALRARRLRIEDLDTPSYIAALEGRRRDLLPGVLAALRTQIRDKVIDEAAITNRTARVKQLIAERIGLPVASAIIETDPRLERAATTLRQQIAAAVNAPPVDNQQLDASERSVLQWGTDLEMAAGAEESIALTNLRRRVVDYRLAAHIALSELPEALLAAVERAEHRYPRQEPPTMEALIALDAAAKAFPRTTERMKRELDSIAASPRVFDETGWQFVSERLELAYRALELTDEATARRPSRRAARADRRATRRARRTGRRGTSARRARRCPRPTRRWCRCRRPRPRPTTSVSDRRRRPASGALPTDRCAARTSARRSRS